MSVYRRLALLALAALTTGCAEGIVVRSTPPRADLYVNGTYAGTTPVTYWVSRADWTNRALPYRVVKAGYHPAEGTFETCVGGGRITAAVFTLGLSLLFKRPDTFCQSSVTVYLTPDIPRAPQ